MSGIAGYKAQIKLGGVPTIFTDEPLIRISDLLLRIENPIKRVLSANHTITITDAVDVDIDPSEFSVNYLEGIVYFLNDIAPDSIYTLPLTISGYYIPLLYIGGAKDYSLEIAGDVLDNTAFHTEDELSEGFRERINGIHDVSASVGRWNDFSNKLIDAKLAQTPIFVSINPGGSKVFAKGWFQIETDSLSGDIGSLEEEAVSLALCGNNTKTYFSYSYNWTDEECEDIDEEDLITNWFPIDA